jgi:hypothetical protein
MERIGVYIRRLISNENKPVGAYLTTLLLINRNGKILDLGKVMQCY